jgi:hypothetical protein
VRRAAERERLARVTVVVLHGGTSSEREVSLVSGRGILEALTTARAGELAPAQVIGIEIDAEGKWLVAGAALEASTAIAVLPSDALYFLGLHGGAGEDGRIQAFLEIAGRAYTGSGPGPRLSAWTSTSRGSRSPRQVSRSLLRAPSFVRRSRSEKHEARSARRPRARGSSSPCTAAPRSGRVASSAATSSRTPSTRSTSRGTTR